MKYRAIFDKIEKERKTKKISVILGPRQAGKTTILKELHKKLGGIFLDIDVFSNFEKVSTYEKFINFAKLKGYEEKQKRPFFIFLDEFQRYADLTMILKNVYDNHDNIKIFVSGSSSLSIKERIQESLAGRKQVSHLYPLSFEEFLRFKEKDDILREIRNLKKIKKGKYFSLQPEAFGLLEEFLVFGGYPEVVLEKNRNGKIEILRNIFDLYIKKDLADFLMPEKLTGASSLIKQIAVNNGAIANFSSYAAVAQIDAKTVKSYVNILKETFLVEVLSPYFSNKNKEIAKSPKIYFVDNGVRNYFYNNFNGLDSRNDAGTLFEGYYIGELIKNRENHDNIKYYRTKNGDEVDIVLEKNGKLIPIELKFKKDIKSSDVKGLRKFMVEYKIKRGYLVNIGEINRRTGISLIDCFNMI